MLFHKHREDNRTETVWARSRGLVTYRVLWWCRCGRLMSGTMRDERVGIPTEDVLVF